MVTLFWVLVAIPCLGVALILVDALRPARALYPEPNPDPHYLDAFKPGDLVKTTVEAKCDGIVWSRNLILRVTEWTPLSAKVYGPFNSKNKRAYNCVMVNPSFRKCPNNDDLGCSVPNVVDPPHQTTEDIEREIRMRKFDAAQ
ncbi:hypothetical protein [Paludibaculum fermentans]|uniref:hypothetical protein n=1 Tax=Paludibaculum fermentans TaxID=1473598 RepID=UPI003EBB6836